MAYSQCTVGTGDANILFLTGFPVLRDWPADWKLPGHGETDNLQNNHHCPRQRVWLEKPVSPSHPKQESLPRSCNHPEQVLAVRCPTCGAAPGEECKLAVGSPRTKPHRDRRGTPKD